MATFASKQSKELIEFAERRGYLLLSHNSGRKIDHITMKCPSGKVIVTTLPKTTHDTKGRHAWFSMVKHAERNSNHFAGEDMAITEQLHHSSKPTPESIEKGKAILTRFGDNPDLKLMRYQATPASQQRCYLGTGSVSGSNEISVRALNWLEQEGYVEPIDEQRTKDKTFYQMTKKGKDFYKSLVPALPAPAPTTPAELIKQASIVEPTPDKDDPGTTRSTARLIPEALAEGVKELAQAAAGIPPTAIPLQVPISDRDQKIINAFESLTDKEVELVLYFGMESLKEDIEREMEKQKARLTAIQEKMAWVSKA